MAGTGITIIKIQLVGDSNEGLTEAHALETQVGAALDCKGSNDKNKDCDVQWILLSTLVHLQRENNKLRFLSSSHSLRVSLVALKQPLFFRGHKADLAGKKHTHKI